MKSCIALTSLIFCIFLISKQIKAQCPTRLVLCSQDSVDAFPRNYPGCHHLNTLKIGDYSCLNSVKKIVDLDSLYQLRYIQNLTIGLYSLIEDFNGLSNVHKIDHVSLEGQKSWKSTLPLDSVHTLDFIFPLDTTTDISLLSSVKFVSNNIRFVGKGNLTPALKYCSTDSLKIHIENNVVKNNIINIMPQNLSLDKISISLLDCRNINFDFEQKVDSIYRLKLFGCHNNNFSALKHLKRIEIFEMQDSNIETFHQFACEEIGYLSIGACNSIISLGDIFPNLKKIKNSVVLYANNNLESIDILDNCALADSAKSGDLYPFGHNFFYIYFGSNRKLITCNSDYLCRAFKRFGDSIHVGNNLMDCNDVLLLKECSLSSASVEDDKNTFSLSPNPVVDILTISPPMPKGIGYSVINLLGNTVKSGEMSDRISLGELPSGHYIIMLDSPDIHKPPQAIKIVKI